MILVSSERKDPTLYGTKQLYFGPVNFKFTVEDVLQKKKKKKKAQED